MTCTNDPSSLPASTLNSCLVSCQLSKNNLITFLKPTVGLFDQLLANGITQVQALSIHYFISTSIP